MLRLLEGGAPFPAEPSWSKLAPLSELERHLVRLHDNPEDDGLARKVVELARAEDRVEEVIGAFEHRGEQLLARDRQVAQDVWLEGALLAEEEELLEPAARLYERVLTADPAHRRALFALGLVLHDLGRWDDLVSLYRRRIAVSTDEGERISLEHYIAELLAEKKDDPHGAFAALVQAARRAPSNLRVIHRLEALGERLGRLDEVAITIGDMLMQQDTAQLRAALAVRLAELYLGPLDDSARALAHLRGALLDDGGNPEVLDEIQDVVRERARFEELARLLEELGGERSESPHRLRFERELARIYERELNDGERAFAALERAARARPSDRELLDELYRVGRNVGQMERLAAALRAAANATENPLLRTLLEQRLNSLPV